MAYKIKENRDPITLWHPYEIRQVWDLHHLVGNPKVRYLPFPLRQSASGTNYCARVGKSVEVVNDEIIVEVRSCVVNKHPKEFLEMSSGSKRTWGTAVLFIPEDLKTDPKKLGLTRTPPR